MKIRVSPNEPGKGYQFTNDIRGGVVPKEYIQPVDQGIQEAMLSGVLGGYEMVDIKVSLCDGSFHELDSNEMAFRIAGSMAFKEAARKAKPVVLEPVMSVEVSSPQDDVARIIDDLTLRRGRVESLEMVGAAHSIKAAVPMSNLLGYATALSGLSHGRADFWMEFKQYEVSPRGRDFDDEGFFAMPAIPKRPQPGGSHLGGMQQEPDADS